MIKGKQDMIDCVTALAHAKNKQDITKSLEIYHDDVELITPAFSANAYGRKQVERQLQYFFRLFPDYHITVSEFSKQGKALHALGLVKLTPNTITGMARSVTIPASMTFEFSGRSIIKEIFNIDLHLLAEKAGIPLDELISS